MRVLIDGKPYGDDEARVSVFDWALQRGYGAFELIRAYAGFPFRLDQHLDRMERSLEIMHLEAPNRVELDEWARRQAAAGGDCFVRIFVTAGSKDSLYSSASRTVVLWEEMPDLPDEFRFLPLSAPWAPGGDDSELTGAKTLSYAPNMAAMLEAQRRGFHDALLLSRDGFVLEGPTFAFCWIKDGALEIPTLDLGLLASVTRAAALELAEALGIEVRTGRYDLTHVLGADELIALSTVKEVSPVIALGDATFAPGPVTARLAAAFRNLVEAELAAERPAAT